MKKTIIISAIIVLTIVIAVLLGVKSAREKAIYDAETDIPKLYIGGNINGMQKKTDVRDISVTYEDGDKTFSCYAELKVQGNTSLRYDKKNYTIKFFTDVDHTKKMDVDMGWGAENKYCLKANWIDKTHARNIVTAKLASEVQQKYGLFADTPHNGLIDGFPIELYHNGNFLGIYTFNIPKDEWMFNMDKTNPNHIVACSEGWDPANVFMAEPDFTTWSLEVGSENEETLTKMKRLFNFVINSSDDEFKNNIDDYLNLDATLNYYVLVDFAYLVDNRGKNMLLVTYDGEIWYPSLYDMDTSWGVSFDGEKAFDCSSYTLNMGKSHFLTRLETCFAEELAQRYFELRQDLLTKEHTMGLFNAFRSEIPEKSFEKEHLRWGNDIPGFDYSQIEGYLDVYISVLDEKYSKLGA